MSIRPYAGRALIKRLPLMTGKVSDRIVVPDALNSREDAHKHSWGMAEVIAVGPGEWRYDRKAKRDVQEPVFVKAGDTVIIDNILTIGVWADVSRYFDDGEYYLAISRQLLAAVEDVA